MLLIVALMCFCVEFIVSELCFVYYAVFIDFFCVVFHSKYVF